MIKYILRCSNFHEFEAWFVSEKGYLEQNKKRQINCPYCSVTKIERNVGGPSVIGSSRRSQAQKEQKYIDGSIHQLKELQKFVETNFEFKGQNFFQAARDLHDENKKEKISSEKGEDAVKCKKKLGIYGQANKEEIKKLKEEGVKVQEILWIKREDA